MYKANEQVTTNLKIKLMSLKYYINKDVSHG